MYKTVKNVNAQIKTLMHTLSAKPWLFLLVMISVFALQTKDVSADTYTKPTVYDTMIYANGFPILIQDGTEKETTTILYDKDGDKIYETTLAENLPYSKTQGDAHSNYTIYGGAHNGNVENVSILVTGGYIDKIEAGGVADGTNKAAEVTGTAEITIQGGKVNWINCGGCAMYGGTAKVSKSIFTMEKGMVKGLVINGNAASSDSTCLMGEVSIYVNGGTITKITDFYSWIKGCTIQTDKLAVLQIDGANVGDCKVRQNYEGLSYKSLPNNYPSLPDGSQAYGITWVVNCDGKDYVEKKLDCLITDKGKEIPLHEAYTYAYETKKQNEETGETEPWVRGLFVSWLPEDTKIEGAKAGTVCFTLKGKEQSTELTNLIPVPTAKSGENVPRYKGYLQTGIDHLYTLTKILPYDISGDDTQEIYPGTYTTTFTLKPGYKWEDMKTEPKTVVWKIRKGYQDPPSGLYSVGEMRMNKNDGYVNGVSQTMEVSTDQKTWESLKGRTSGGCLRNLAPGDYYFRYAETNTHEASEAVKISVAAAPVYTLSILDYESGTLIEEISADIINRASKIYIPETYADYAFITQKAGGVTDLYVFSLDESGYHAAISSDLSLYALAPSYLDVAASFDLSNDKTLSVSLPKDGSVSSEQTIANYFVSSIMQKALSTTEFGDLSQKKPDEITQFLCGQTFYMTPCPADASDGLTQGDQIVARISYQDAKVIPHISLTPEKDSVMSLKMEAVKEGNGLRIGTLHFKGVKKEGLSEVLALDLGQNPYEINARILRQSPMQNIVYKTTMLKVKYGQGKEPETKEPGSGEDPKGPGSKEGPLPGQTSVSGNELISLSRQDEIITGANTDKGDPAGSTFRFLKPRVTKVKKHEITIGWKPLKEADGYVIYGAKCGSKMKKLRTIQNPKARSCTFKKLKKGTYYKYIVVAYKNAQKTESDADGSKIVLSASTSLHAATTGGRKKNPLGIKLKKSRIGIKRGKSAKIRASMIKKGKVQYHIAKFRYESLDPDIATVSKSGKVKGLKKGRTKVLIYTQNGIYKTVSVTVK